MDEGLELFSLTSGEYYTIFENMQEGITVYRIIYDNNGNVADLIIKYANPASSTSKMFLNKKFTGKSITKLYGPRAISSFLNEVNEIVSTGEIKKYETYSSLIDSYFMISAFSPAKNLYVTLTSDITEQKRAEKILLNAKDNLEIKVQERTKELLTAIQEKELLLREIHHRVKNNLQIISSLLNLQIPYIKDSESIEFFKESQNRVKSISMIHEKLYQSNNLQKIDFESYLSNIMVNLFQTYGVNQDRISYEINCEDIKLNMETSVPCGLIITELVTNSIKHAFPDPDYRPLNKASGNNSNYKVTVLLYLENEYINLVIKDNGIGFPENLDYKNTESLGLKLVNTLINQLDGTIGLDKSRRNEVFRQQKSMISASRRKIRDFSGRESKIQGEGTQFSIRFKELKYEERI